MPISSPKFLTQSIHEAVLNALRSELSKLKSQQGFPNELQALRIRNWLFLVEEGMPTIDIILDKGYNTAQVENNVTPRQANTSLSFDECAFIHESILSTNALDELSDDVCVRFGTPGSEPTLYDVEDFQASVEDMVRLELWEPLDGRSKFTMILVDIFEKEGNSIAVVSEGSKRYEIPLKNLKTAFVLPFHPASKSMKNAKKGSKKTK